MSVKQLLLFPLGLLLLFLLWLRRMSGLSFLPLYLRLLMLRLLSLLQPLSRCCYSLLLLLTDRRKMPVTFQAVHFLHNNC